MKHEDFPVKGFEFMNEPASDEQKRIIIDLAIQAGHNMAPDSLTNPNAWPKPFSKWDAGSMINALKEQLGKQTLDGSCDCPSCNKRQKESRAELSSCETFCHACGQLRLWLHPEKPTICGNCGSTAIEVDKRNSERLEKLREQYRRKP